MSTSDFLVVGGGIVGCAAAFKLMERYPDAKITLVEKEQTLAFHQTGRNSGVIHSGVYYKPGSLKSRNCTAGRQALISFCDAEQIPYEICGKVVVATEEREIPALERLQERCRANAVPCTRIGPAELKDLEPAARGLAALHVPGTGIIAFRAVVEKLAEKLKTAGHQILLSTKAGAIRESASTVSVHTSAGIFECAHLVNCAGLHSDRVARMLGLAKDIQIIPFRGEFYEVHREAQHLCRNLIYPVPDPAFPFLGVHFTRMLAGGVECGPNAVLAFGREAYNWLTLMPRDLLETLSFPGFLRMSLRHWRMGLFEMWRSLSKPAFVRSLQKLVPGIESSHIQRGSAGIRAQAVQLDGSLVDDFVIQKTVRTTHVLNAPSPAATASLAIGAHIAAEAGR